ncbi:MAG: DMT family transporter, partial [Anaerolineae bacterium]|nr:DMT family transporter [Anaerolineae bacterium]
MFSARLTAVFQALLVTFIWSVSWVLIKIGLQGIPPLTFAGLRYTLAFGCLLVFGLRSPRVRHELRQLKRGDWRQLIGLGLVFYALTQGAQFAGLVYLPSATLSLLLNLTPVVVAGIGIFTLGERPSRSQVAGIALLVGGVLVYFYPASFPSQQI